MTDTPTICENLARIRERIALAAERGAYTHEVRICAVTKSVASDRIVEATACGQLLFGESYVQEAREKIVPLRQSVPAICFHFMGRVQRNKVREIVRLFDLVESVDRWEVAAALAEESSRAEKTMPVLLQVNISGEETKNGVLPVALPTLVERVLSVDRLRLQGLMAIGTFFADDAEECARRREFTSLRELRNDIEKRYGVELPQLSMGMSSDFELAVEEGATIVRIGSAIFGARKR